MEVPKELVILPAQRATKEINSPIPPGAWERYGFHIGDEAFFVKGSRKSGGFGLNNRKMLAGFSHLMSDDRTLGYGVFKKGMKADIPDSIPIDPGDQLLTVFGSRNALGFITRGLIYKEALKHLELEVFKDE